MLPPQSQAFSMYAKLLVRTHSLRFVVCCASAIVSAILFTSSAPAQSYTFTTFAGPSGGAGADDATGSAARFSFPQGVATDSNGNVYVADTSNDTIRKITPAGSVSTLAGVAAVIGHSDGIGSAARFFDPGGVATDSTGNVYVADTGNHTIRKITPMGLVTTLAGSAGLSGSADGTGSDARFIVPRGVATDSNGNVYVVDSGNYKIRKITPAGVVTTFVPEAYLGTPTSVATDRSGNVYVTDDRNGGILKITPTGVITGIAAALVSPEGVAVDNNGSVYVAVSGQHTIQKITPAGVVTTFAGSAGLSGSTDGIESDARFAVPRGVATDGSGNVYVADMYNHAIRKITPAGVVTTLAGSAALYGSADGTGSEARFSAPSGVAADSSGNIYVADGEQGPFSLTPGSHTIRKITPTRVVTTLAGSAGLSGSTDGMGSTARFFVPSGVATDSNGNVYVADTGNHTIRKITPAGAVTTLGGSAGQSGSFDGMGSTARFFVPSGVATDSNGNVYIADTGNGAVRKITPSGAVTTLAGGFSTVGVATDSSSTIYVAGGGNNAILKVTSAGAVTTLAGELGGVPGSIDATGSAARFSAPHGVATDSTGNVYVADTNNHTIRKISPTGVVTTLGGSARLSGNFGPGGSNDGTGTSALFNFPMGVAVDSHGNIYVADTSNGKIRIGTPALADAATIDFAIGPAGATRQLNALPRTATNWQWSIIRQPSGSSAALSSTSIPNPLFTPDVADLYMFRLIASNGVSSSITIVSLTATRPRKRVVHQ